MVRNRQKVAATGRVVVRPSLLQRADHGLIAKGSAPPSSIRSGWSSYNPDTVNWQARCKAEWQRSEGRISADEDLIEQAMVTAADASLAAGSGSCSGHHMDQSCHG